MTVIFEPYELPVAYSMIRAARLLKPHDEGYHPFNKYIYYWTAFNNIYTTIAFTGGHSTTIKLLPNGAVKTKKNGNVFIPIVKKVIEKDQIDLAFAEFDDNLKHRLVIHPSTAFFINRIPSWEDKNIATDKLGQQVNGVLNVNHTTHSDYPVWSPVDLQLYAKYMANQNDKTARDFLSKQIVELLYTVRNNLLHGGKRFDNENDITVVENALPLLVMIVSAFTR